MKRCLVLWLLVFSSAVFAHDLYLRADPFVLSKPGRLTLKMFLAAAFPGERMDWRADKTVHFFVEGPTGQKILTDNKKDPLIAFEEEGTYIIGWQASPSSISESAKEFNEYIKAEDYRNVIEARKNANQQSTGAKERYVRFLKTFVQVGSNPTKNFDRRLNFKIELIPLINPYVAKVGSELPFLLLFDGKPLAGNRVMATYDTYSTKHDAYAQILETNGEGIVTVKITHSGVWMIRSNRMVVAEGDPKADWDSYWSNCSFEVPQ